MLKKKWSELKAELLTGDLNWRLLLLGLIISALTAAACPYASLKLGMSVDLSMGGMFVVAMWLRRYARDNKQLAVWMNIIQTMAGAIGGIGFAVVAMAAFHYIQNVFDRGDVGFHPTWWQMALFLWMSANLGVFVGAWPRRMILADKTLPWATAKGSLGIIQPMTAEEATEKSRVRRAMLVVSTLVTGFLTYLRDGLGVIPAAIGNAALKISMGAEFLAIGLGIMLPLSVGLSGLLGVWFISAFGETVAKLSALVGTAPEHWEQCRVTLNTVGKLAEADKATALAFLGANCGEAAKLVDAKDHFGYVLKWMMWPATAMMLTSALTSVLVGTFRRPQKVGEREEDLPSNLADEHIPRGWIIGGTIICSVALIWIVNRWFGMPWRQTLAAILMQCVLIIAGLRVLATTGQGPVSLLANATQFFYGLIWRAQIKLNLLAALISAAPEAVSEVSVPSFWVAQRLGGKFKTLITAQLIVIPIGAVIVPIMYNVLVGTYGIGLEEGQLSAPTALKIAALAIVMEKGISALPHGALTASIIGAVIGILFEVLLSLRKKNGAQRFPWIPVLSALGFALILPPSLSIGTAIGCVLAAAWREFSPGKDGSFGRLNLALGAGLMAGEAIVASIVMPALLALQNALPR